MGAVFENELFQVQKGALVLHALSDLDQRLPGSLSKDGLTLDALLVADDVRDHKGLLQDRSGLHFALDRQSHLEAHRVRLGPDPAGIRQSHTGLFEAAHVLQTEGHEFATFQFAGQPLTLGFVPPLATATLVQRGFGADALGDVGGAGEAGGARVGGVGLNGYAAQTAQDGCHLWRRRL